VPTSQEDRNVAKVTMPQLGESVAEGTIGKWLKKPGESVARDEPLLEVITDKVNAEVPSPFDGILREILVVEGQTVPYNAEIAVIEEVAGASTGRLGSADRAAAADADGRVVGAASVPAVGTGPASAASSPAPGAIPASAASSPAPGAIPASAAGSPAPGTGPASAAGSPAPGAISASATGSPAAPGFPAPAATLATKTEAARDLRPIIAVGDPNARMTPAVRLLMRRHGLSPIQIAGTGHAGRITREDVLTFVERQPLGAATSPGWAGGGSAAGYKAATAVESSAGPGVATAGAPATGRGAATPAAQAGVSPDARLAPMPDIPSHSPGLAPAAPSTSSSASVAWEPGQDEVLVPHSQMRRGIAAQMTRAAAVPVAHSTFEADMTAVVKLRGEEAEAYKAREGVGLSFLPFVVKAVVEGLHSNPDLNAHYTEAGLLRKRRINIGIAIAVENGLIVPVIHDADQLSINGLNRAIQDLAARARTNKLRLEDLQGGTFTVDNTGWFGSVLTVPIINPPEVCILTTEAVVKRPVVRETPEGDVIAVRSMMNLVAGYDHRATDGAQVGRFARDVICWLEAVGPDTPIY
jgi:pyruvate/2-oxoglutarate dehydrogenase complex dihydrolipoamide acyltransferase (E2) component